MGLFWKLNRHLHQLLTCYPQSSYKENEAHVFFCYRLFLVLSQQRYNKIINYLCTGLDSLIEKDFDYELCIHLFKEEVSMHLFHKNCLKENNTF